MVLDASVVDTSPWLHGVVRATLRNMKPSLQDLTPGAREAVEKFARESGKPFADALSELVVRGAAGASTGNGAGQSADGQEAAWQSFLAAGREHAKALPQGHVVDDSRESIYSGRGE